MTGIQLTGVTRVSGQNVTLLTTFLGNERHPLLLSAAEAAALGMLLCVAAGVTRTATLVDGEIVDVESLVRRLAAQNQKQAEPEKPQSGVDIEAILSNFIGKSVQ